MALNLVTGYKGRDHITAEQWADFNRGIFGEAAILPVGNKMAVSIQTANQITVKDGVAVFDGREVYIGYGESENITIQSGTQGMKRKDIVVVKYTRYEETGVETVAFEVVNGLPASSNPKDPVYQNTDIRTGVFVSQKPFCRVRINGTAIEGIDMLVAEKIFKTVAFTGNYNDLSGRPALKAVATSGDYNDLTNKPASLPANGGNAATVGGKSAETLQNYNNLTNKPSLGGAASKNVANNFTTNTDGYVADARTVKKLKDDLAANFNQNRTELTNSSYYPDVVVYRSGQVVYMKCAGTLSKEVPANAAYVVGVESMMPEEFRPNANIVACPNISFAGKNIKVEIMSSGRVVFTSPEKLPVGFGLNMHFTYMTGKSNF